MLHIVLGPMCAGKTSKLIEDYDTFTGTKLIIDYDIGDKELLFASFVETHDGIKRECYKSKHLEYITNIYKQWGNYQISNEFSIPYTEKNAPEMYKITNEFLSCDSIFINEAQFFPDLYEFVLKYLNKNKQIYLYGLDGDFQQNKMGHLLDLIPHCDTVVKLKSKCLCGKEAIFTFRDSEETVQYLPNATYIPLCRACFSNKK